MNWSKLLFPLFGLCASPDEAGTNQRGTNSKGALTALGSDSATSNALSVCWARDDSAQPSSRGSQHEPSESQILAWFCCFVEWSLLFILLEYLVLQSKAKLLFEQTNYTALPCRCEWNPFPTCSLPLRPCCHCQSWVAGEYWSRNLIPPLSLCRLFTWSS